MSHTVSYYQIPGRGEVVRLMLAIAELPFTEDYISSPDWKAGRKASSRWGTIPEVMLPSGQVAGQSRALLRYLGKHAKTASGEPLYPIDPALALAVDEVCDYVEDIWAKLIPILRQPTSEDKDKLGAALMASGGEVTTMLDRLEAVVAGPTVCAGTPTIADVYIFAAFGWWSTGFFGSAVNLDSLVASRPKLAGVLDAAAASRRIRAYYTKTAPQTTMWAPYRTMISKL